MRVVVVGSGGREHALAHGLSKDADVLVTPGSDAMAATGLAVTSTSPLELEADLFVIGPEVPLVAGLADALRAQGKSVFGPGADGARLEGSKAFMKELLASADVPTAAFGSFSHAEAAAQMLRSLRPPYVVKTDGLAAGKGVLVTDSLEDAIRDVTDKLSGAAFGDAGSTVVVEEGLEGEECSLLVLVDSQRAIPLLPAQDYKRIGDDDTGANTGGMGALAPLRRMDDELVALVMSSVIEPTMRELQRRSIDYRGVLYAGLMLTNEGPKLLEYNVRFGDPETQVVVPMMASSLSETLLAVAEGTLTEAPRFHEGGAVTVVLAAKGYPESPVTGDVIDGLGTDGQLADPIEGVTIYHAGTRRRDDGRFETAGGRVLNVTARAGSVSEARALAYEAAAQIDFNGRQLRSDIARGK